MNIKSNVRVKESLNHFVLFIDGDLIAVSSSGSDWISINVLTLHLIKVTSSFLPVDLEVTFISSANERRFALMKFSIRSKRVREKSEFQMNVKQLLNY